MKTTTLTFALVSLPLALGACVNQSPLPGDADDDPGAAAEEMVRVTVLDRDDSGEQTEKVSLLRRSEVTALEAQRQSALSGKRAAEDKQGENIGAAQQKLSVQANATNCFATGLLIYSGLNRSGAMLCLRTAGHEAGGTAGFSLPADWQSQNGGKYPASFWAGVDGGRFASYSNVFSFAPWTINEGTPAVEAVQNANYVGMDRALNAPATDPSIAVPANYPLVQKMAARGHQIYVCKDLGAGSFAWTLSAPSAVLYDTHAPGDIVAWHFAGPQWRSADDGSSIRAQKVSQVASPIGSIPWLRLDVVERSGLGLFTPVAIVQRINTTGGLAPATTCDQYSINQTVWVDYTADYYFYAAPTPPATWLCPASYYNGNDGCDCNCGGPDPDCAKLNQSPFGCYGGQVCNQSGQCGAP